ncbi:MAG: 4Fe-4S binding protein [Desulfopila sp.]|jgi:MinD superfamily P-loop ATPase|nr:4Fe-4S binding protein [Desulfopila sp.]
MKEYVIISGKGGTGKTSLTASFALLAQAPILCDADVDAADLHLLLQPKVVEHHDFSGGNLAVINQEDCTQCGTCLELCRFEAISTDFVIDPIQCEGCGVCVDFCPEKAIDFPQQKCGEWYISDTRVGPMVHARLGIAEENSGKLVSVIRRQARQIAEDKGHDLIITDGPPGIGCPVIASITGAEAVIIIVEPTISGMHDVERVTRLTSHFGIQAMLCVNRYDINLEMTEKIEQFAEKEDLVILPKIPFDPDFTMAMVKGKTLIEFAPDSATSSIIKEVWQTILDTPEAKRPLTLKKHVC